MDLQNSTKETVGEFLSDEWITRIAECRLAGWNENYLIDYFVTRGSSREDVTNYLQVLDADPIFKAATIISMRFKKLESLLGAKESLKRVSEKEFTVDRRNNLSADEFREEYYSKNKPVIITDIVENWKAYHTWSPKFFAEKLEDQIVEVMTNRESDPLYEVNASMHKSSCTMREYVEMVESSENSNNFYLVANNYFFASDESQKLLNDLLPTPGFLNPDNTVNKIFLWFGPAGTVTPLHHDEMNILLAQIKGRKKIVLISPLQILWLYNDENVFSSVDHENPDLEKHPFYDYVRKIELILNPGEALFLPVGWWHHVRALDVSISVSFTNFNFPNTYGWKNPSIVK